MTTKEKIGLILGTCCFMPCFILFVLMMDHNIFIIGSILIITQVLFMEALYLCTNEIKKENKELKEKLLNMTKEDR